MTSPTRRSSRRSARWSRPATRAEWRAARSRSTSRPRSRVSFAISPGRLPRMADVRRYELEELANRPGTYYNPTTEVVIVVDDSTAIETVLVDEDDEMEWVLLGDEPAVDEHKRDELVTRFETRSVGTGPDTDDEIVEEEDELEPDPEEGY